ncbi:MAG: phospholipase/carboxylesterase [Lentimonas sp.]|jgi:phospholipase/carboxylesterase
MHKLEFFEREPLSKQKPKKLIIFLHGYGSSGDNLIGLSKEFEKAAPDAHFISPNAPFSLNYPMMMGGYQWFPLDNRDPKVMYPKVLEANEILDAFISSQLNKFELTRKDVILIGFSQGSMMAMFNGLKNEEQGSGIIAYSGRLILPSWLGCEIKSKPKICLIHGKDDEVVTFDNFLEAKKILTTEQIPFEDHALNNLGHSIDFKGVKIAKEFLQNLNSN